MTFVTIRMRGQNIATHLLERLADDRDYGLTVVLVQALFAQDLHDDLGAQVERRSETTVMREDRRSVAEVNDAGPDRTEERRDHADEDILLLEFCTSLRTGT